MMSGEESATSHLSKSCHVRRWQSELVMPPRVEQKKALGRSSATGWLVISPIDFAPVPVKPKNPGVDGRFGDHSFVDCRPPARATVPQNRLKEFNPPALKPNRTFIERIRLAGDVIVTRYVDARVCMRRLDKHR
jgi:hypothetical protein